VALNVFISLLASFRERLLDFRSCWIVWFALIFVLVFNTLQTIQQDLRSNNLSLNEANDVAQNRPLWRLMSTNVWHCALLVVHDRNERNCFLLTDAHCCHMDTVPDRIKQSFVIFDIRAIWCSWLSVRVPGWYVVQIDLLTYLPIIYTQPTCSTWGGWFHRRSRTECWDCTTRERRLDSAPTSLPASSVQHMNLLWQAAWVPQIKHINNPVISVGRGCRRPGGDARSPEWCFVVVFLVVF